VKNIVMSDSNLNVCFKICEFVYIVYSRSISLCTTSRLQ